MKDTTSNSVNSNYLSIACPHCGSTSVHKSIGGKIEHAVAWGATKMIKSSLLGDYGSLTGGVETEIIKKEVPFQQVCDYCHRSFHASQSQIDKGAYSMKISRARELMNIYNKKLQSLKEQEIETIREKAQKELRKTLISVFVFIVALIVSQSVEHETEGVFGLTTYTYSYSFSCMLMVGATIYAMVKGLNCKNSYTEASELEAMPIEEYAKNHSA